MLTTSSSVRSVLKLMLAYFHKFVRRFERKAEIGGAVSTISWNYVRNFLRGKVMTLHADGIVWRAVIENSYHMYFQPGTDSSIYLSNSVQQYLPGKVVSLSSGKIVWRHVPVERSQSRYRRDVDNTTDLHNLRIMPKSGFTWRSLTNSFMETNEFIRCRRFPRVIIATRLIDCYVTNDEWVEAYDEQGQILPEKVLVHGGDLWCYFEIPKDLQRPGGPECNRGLLVIEMGRDAQEILAEARRAECERYRAF